MQLRFEVYNLFNTVNFLGGSLTNGGRHLRRAERRPERGPGRPIVSAQPAGNFGQLTAARDPRTVQLGIRLAF